MALEHLYELSGEDLHKTALRRDQFLKAWEIERQRFLKECLANGRAKGLAEGEAKGREEERLEIAKQMLKRDFSLSEISELIDLSDADINQLKE